MTHLERIAHDLSITNPAATPQQFLALMLACRVWEYPWGVIFANDNELHIHVLSQYRKHVFLRKPLREVAGSIFKQYPVIKTSIRKDKPNALAFDLRMGWRLIAETDTEWHLEMTQKDFNYGKS